MQKVSYAPRAPHSNSNNKRPWGIPSAPPPRQHPPQSLPPRQPANAAHHRRRTEAGTGAGATGQAHPPTTHQAPTPNEPPSQGQSPAPHKGQLHPARTKPPAPPHAHRTPKRHNDRQPPTPPARADPAPSQQDRQPAPPTPLLTPGRRQPHSAKTKQSRRHPPRGKPPGETGNHSHTTAELRHCTGGFLPSAVVRPVGRSTAALPSGGTPLVVILLRKKAGLRQKSLGP
jgi:hypothetical protein